MKRHRRMGTMPGSFFRSYKTLGSLSPQRSPMALVGFQSRGFAEVVQSHCCHSFLLQWFGQKSGGDSAVRPEFVIAGMIFHPSRVQSELLYKYIEQPFVELTLLPARHREDVWLLTLRHAQVRSAHQIERRQRSVEMKV